MALVVEIFYVHGPFYIFLKSACAGRGIFQDNWVNTIADDTVDPCLPRNNVIDT